MSTRRLPAPARVATPLSFAFAVFFAFAVVRPSSRVRPPLLLVDAARSLSARPAVRRRPADRYDRAVTTFDPDGRLRQLEYSMVAAERGRGLTVCAEWDGVVVFAFPSASDGAAVAASAAAERENDPTTDDRASFAAVDGRVHRLSPTLLIVTSGLAGDARTLASVARRLAARAAYVDAGEAVPAREVASEVGSLRHGVGLRTGGRVLGVHAVLIGLDDDEDDECDDDSDSGIGAVGMYRSLPGGSVDRCHACCSGGTDEASRKQALEAVIDCMDSMDADAEAFSDAETNENRSDEELRRLVEAMGRIVASEEKDRPDPIPSSKVPPRGGSGGDAPIGAAAWGSRVDIWMVRAVARRSSHAGVDGRSDDGGGSDGSDRRRLGCASMKIRCARRVSVDQLSSAARRLTD